MCPYKKVTVLLDTVSRFVYIKIQSRCCLKNFVVIEGNRYFIFLMSIFDNYNNDVTSDESLNLRYFIMVM